MINFLLWVIVLNVSQFVVIFRIYNSIQKKRKDANSHKQTKSTAYLLKFKKNTRLDLNKLKNLTALNKSIPKRPGCWSCSDKERVLGRERRKGASCQVSTAASSSLPVQEDSGLPTTVCKEERLQNYSATYFKSTPVPQDFSNERRAGLTGLWIVFTVKSFLLLQTTASHPALLAALNDTRYRHS